MNIEIITGGIFQNIKFLMLPQERKAPKKSAFMKRVMLILSEK
ncbi:MAG: hypothetical protein ACJA1Z_003838 [Patiriisocius sp.]